jgi:hypothetical protein
MSGATVTSDANGTSVTYPPMSGYGMGYGNNNGDKLLEALILQNSQTEGFHHVLNREAQIQADIAANQGLTQVAISAAQNAVNTQAGAYALNAANELSQFELASANGNAQTQLQAANNYGNTLNAIATARENINQQARENFTLVANNGMANARDFGAVQTQAAVNAGVLAAAIISDGDKTRALINQNNIETLNRQLATAQNEIIELRGDRASISRHHDTEVKVNQNVNQQQQQQQQQATLGAILGRLEGLTQVAHATNQNVIAGNTGAVQTGAQTSNPTNIRT